MDRKGMKANARKAYKRHYWMIVVICLFASVFGVAYSSSTWSVNASSPSATVQEDGTAQSDNVSKVLENLLVGDESQARRQVEHNQEQIVQNDTNAMMGRKRGVFASLLNLFTLGLSGIFYSNGYNAAFFVEYYVHVRGLSKDSGLEGSELLSDEYLYSKASAETLHAAYGDVAETVEQLSSNLVPVDKPNGFVGFLSEWLGVRILHARSVTKYEEYREQLHQIDTGREILDGAIYPGRLAPAPMAFRFRESRTVSSDRSYSLVNLVMMFFIFCFVGWVWEVSLAFISEGTFVNRGTLHGPWLPIYGTGGVIILILLKKLRKKPLFEFLAAMVLCGGLEYFSSWYLEKTHGGQRWWDYTGYFLNLNGRICAEGLLTFGLGGLAIVYLLAPALDNLLSRIDTRKLTVVAVVLLAFYCVDQAYSAQHPNIGAGITDYKGSATSQVS